MPDRPSKEQIIAALEANNGNAKKTAKQLGMPLSTLRYTVGRSNAHGRTPSPNQLPEQRSELAARWKAVAEKGTALALKAMEGIDPSQLKSRDVKDLLVGAAVATEKHQLLIGAATARTEGLKVSLVVPDGLRSLALGVLVGRTETAQQPQELAGPATSIDGDYKEVAP